MDGIEFPFFFFPLHPLLRIGMGWKEKEGGGAWQERPRWLLEGLDTFGHCPRGHAEELSCPVGLCACFMYGMKLMLRICMSVSLGLAMEIHDGGGGGGCGEQKSSGSIRHRML